MRDVVKTGPGLLPAMLGAAVCVLLATGSGAAQCGSNKAIGKALGRSASWNPQMKQRLLRTAYGVAGDSEQGNGKDAIVGMWHFQFWLPDTSGAEIDGGYQQWHTDGTEMALSGLRAPLTGDVCMGVWERTGERTYKMNHYGIAYSADGVTLVATDNIREDITVSADGKTYSGTFSVTEYTEDLQVKFHIAGVVLATRVDVDSGMIPVH
jgi:hypothetical protein